MSGEPQDDVSVPDDGRLRDAGAPRPLGELFSASILNSQQLDALFQPYRAIAEQALEPLRRSTIQWQESLVSPLLRNIRPVLDSYLASLLPKVRVDLSNVFPRITREALADFVRRALPPNWRDAGVSFADADAAEAIIREEGIPLIWVPPGDLVRLLIDAPRAATRDRLLVQRAEEVLADARRVLAEADRPETVTFCAMTRRAIDAWAGGHHEAAQALAAVTFDAAVNGVLGMKPGRATHVGKRDYRDVGLNELTWTLVMNAVPKAYTTYHYERSDRVPHEFSRHATVHAIASEQYTPRNGLVAIMLVVSVLREAAATLDLLAERERPTDARRTDAAS